MILFFMLAHQARGVVCGSGVFELSGLSLLVVFARVDII
jgi:hypothetical protein